jgi:hypothetical protein
MEVELRCTGSLHGILTSEGLIERKCHSYKCGASSEVVVLHYFDPITGALVKTNRYRDAKILFERKPKKETTRT